MRKRKLLIYNLLQRKSCPGVTFTYQGMTFQILSTQNLSTQDSMTDVGLCSHTGYSRCIHSDNAYIVQKCSFLNELFISL